MTHTNKSLLAVAVKCIQLHEAILMGEANTPTKVQAGITQILNAHGDYQAEIFENRIQGAGQQ
jgi:hypothetical protein